MTRNGELFPTNYRYIWRIQESNLEDKKPGEFLTSPIITISNDTKLSLNFYPSGRNGDFANYVSLYLRNETKSDQKISFKLSILNFYNKTIYEDVHVKQTLPLDGVVGNDKYISKKFLHNKNNKLIIDGILTIICEIYTDRYGKSQIGLIDDLLKTFEYLLTSKVNSDVIIYVSGHKLEAHKNILSARSKFFYDIFSNDKNNKVPITSITINDVSYEVMKEILKFIYTGRVTDIEVQSKLLFAPAVKFELTSLKQLCEQVTLDRLNIDNACDILIVADRYDCDKLENAALAVIVENLNDVIVTKSYDELWKNHPELNRKILDIVKEKKNSNSKKEQKSGPVPGKRNQIHNKLED